MPELSALERSGRHALMRKFYGDGRWGYFGAGPTESWNGWTITKRRSRKIAWARSNGHKKSYKTHAVKYRIKAVHEQSGTASLLTVWRCGQSTFAPISAVKEPTEVCAGCWARIEHLGTVRL